MSVSSDPGQPQRPNQSSGAWTVALVVLAVAGMMLLVCCGGLAGLGMLFYTRTEKVAGQVKSAIQRGSSRPPPPAAAWQTDWVAMSQLTPAYTAAVDAVAENAEVRSTLGEPIELTGDPQALFRRESEGAWTGMDETIEFDIRGPKGDAVVRVLAGGPTADLSAPPAFYRGLVPKTIKVVLADGTEIDVPPPVTAEAPMPK